MNKLYVFLVLCCFLTTISCSKSNDDIINEYEERVNKEFVDSIKSEVLSVTYNAVSNMLLREDVIYEWYPTMHLLPTYKEQYSYYINATKQSIMISVSYISKLNVECVNKHINDKDVYSYIDRAKYFLMYNMLMLNVNLNNEYIHDKNNFKQLVSYIETEVMCNKLTGDFSNEFCYALLTELYLTLKDFDKARYWSEKISFRDNLMILKSEDKEEIELYSKDYLYIMNKEYTKDAKDIVYQTPMCYGMYNSYIRRMNNE